MDEKVMDEKAKASFDEMKVDEQETFRLAQLAAEQEHQQTVWEALKTERKSVFWSVAVSTAIIMEGYDIVLVTSLFAQQAFNERYGTYVEGHGYQVPAPWQSALGIAPTLGAILGGFLNGWLTFHFGYRKVLLASLGAIAVFIFPLFFSPSLAVFLIGLILCGIPWGVFATLAPAYSSEICSLTLRGHLTIYVNLCWAIGQLIAAGVLSGFSDSTGEWAYRIPFGLQWIFPLPLFIIICFAPESPWWLIKRGRIAEAKVSLRRLTSAQAIDKCDDTVALIQHTMQIEDETQRGTSYFDCFKGTDLRRTEIICMCFAAQVWCGSPLGGTPAYFLVQAGLSSDNAFYISVGGLGLACIGTVISWFLINHIGRRTLYVWGMGLLTALLLVVGVIASVTQSSGGSYAQGGLVVLWLFIYYLTVGPVCYAIIAETSAMRLRNKSVCLSRIAYYLSQVVGNSIQPQFVNPGAANWGGKTGYFWAGTSMLFFVWTYFRLPETKGRSYEELDILFEGQINARKFSKTHVDAYAEPGQRIKLE